MRASVLSIRSQRTSCRSSDATPRLADGPSWNLWIGGAAERRIDGQPSIILSSRLDDVGLMSLCVGDSIASAQSQAPDYTFG
jgi:hypothetical protein